MRILITGGTGFIGKNVVRELSKDYEVYAVARNQPDNYVKKRFFQQCQFIRCDLTNATEVKQILKIIKPHIIIHLAGNPLVKLNEHNPSEIIQTNVVATQNLCHYSEPKTHIIFASSVLVYGDLSIAKSERSSCKPISMYGATKLASESIISAYQTLNNISYTNLRLCATVGEGLTHGIISDFIKKIQSNNEYFELIGKEPGSIKPFCHVSDVIQVIKMSISGDIRGDFNVVPDGIISVDAIAKLFMCKFKSNKKLKWLDNNWKGDNPIILCDNSKLILSGWKPKYNSVQAVERAIDENTVCVDS